MDDGFTLSAIPGICHFLIHFANSISVPAEQLISSHSDLPVNLYDQTILELGYISFLRLLRFHFDAGFVNVSG